MMHSKVYVYFLIGIWLLFGFQLFIFVHELGHWLTAAILQINLTLVDLYPLRISSILAESGRWDIVFAGSGIVLGSVLPLLTWPLWKTTSGHLGLFLQLWSGFCILANGVYLAVGWLETYSDSGLLRKSGCPVWLLLMVGAAVSVGGYVFLRRTISKRATELERAGWIEPAGWLGAALLWILCQYALAVWMSP